MHVLGIKPTLGSHEEVIKFLKVFGNVKEEPVLDDPTTTGPVPKTGTYHLPKLSTFYGEEGKGEVKGITFKYEVESLLIDRDFSDEQIMLGIRRTLKGSAGDKIRRLHPALTF